MINKEGIWDLDEAREGHAHSIELAKALIKVLPTNRMVYDLGCGLGFYANELTKAKYTVLAYEGTPNIEQIAIHDHIIQHNLIEPLPYEIQGNVLCLEVGEHIPKEHEQVFIDNLCNSCADIMVLSWAIPGQGGRGHVNEQPNQYIIDEVEKRGFIHREAKSMYLRNNSGKLWWFKNTLMWFERV